EAIPGEEDDLPELPELPDDTVALVPPIRTPGPVRVESVREDASRGEPRRGKRGRRGRRGRGDDRGRRDRQPVGAEETQEPLEPSESAPIDAGRKSLILVNAADPEEQRVGVVESGRLVDFQMTVRTENSVVNDIYRGRVVNLESAIGAAFVDFGQGRN